MSEGNEVVTGSTGRTYAPSRSMSAIDIVGFLQTGTTEKPLTGELECKIAAVIEKDETVFMIAEILASKGKLQVANRDGEVMPLKAGMGIGIGRHAAIAHVFSQKNVGKVCLLRYGTTAKNPKTKRTYRVVDAFFETSDKDDEKVPF